MQLVTPPRRRGIPPGAILTLVRTMPPAVAAIALLAATPAIVVAASGRQSFTGALSAAALLAGAGVGYAADDPAAPTLASSPTTLAVRRTLRATVIAVTLGGGWLTALLVAARYGHPAPNPQALAAELCAAASLSAALASRARTDAPVATGFGAAAAALMAMISISSLSYRWSVLPSLGGGAGHARWWWIAAAGAVTAAWSSRDPAGRRPPRATRRSGR